MLNYSELGRQIRTTDKKAVIMTSAGELGNRGESSMSPVKHCNGAEVNILHCVKDKLKFRELPCVDYWTISHQFSLTLMGLWKKQLVKSARKTYYSIHHKFI